MREIEFRGQLIKDQYGKKKGEWVYGYFYEECGLTYIIESTQKQHGSICYKNIPYIVDKETVGQFTGIKDCNEMEIYEDDILEDFDWIIGVVVLSARYGVSVRNLDTSYSLKNYCLDSEMDSGSLTNIRVISNIHNNPELSK